VNSDKVKLTREELYDLVWSKPFTTLVKEYSYSDNGLRKICKKHNIPTPKFGHWAKMKHSKNPPKISLPKADNVIIELALRTGDENEPIHSNSEVAKIKNELLQSKISFTVPDRLSSPHPLVKKANEILKEHTTGGYGRGRDIIYSKGECLGTEATRPNIPRALRIWDTLIKLLLKRGHEISKNKNSRFLIYGEEFTIRVREILKREKVKDSRWERFESVGSGILSIKIDSIYPEKEWRDQKSKTLEDQLLNILAKIEQLAHKEKKERIERQAYWKKMEEEEAKEKEKQEKITAELNGFKNLFDTASRWHKSQYLRNYIAEFEKYAIKTNTLDNQKQRWISWAKEKADWYDPFIEKEVELLKEIDRETLERKKRW